MCRRTNRRAKEPLKFRKFVEKVRFSGLICELKELAAEVHEVHVPRRDEPTVEKSRPTVEKSRRPVWQAIAV